jgi:hypothetical protein
LAVLAEEIIATAYASELRKGIERDYRQELLDEDEADAYYGDQDDWREDR